MHQVTPSTQEKLIALLKTLCTRDLGFRGQADAEWPITSSFDRAFGDRNRDALLKEENALFERFRDEVVEHLPSEVMPHWIYGLPEMNRVVGWQVMQHYCAPTRLVDWTYCPFVAALWASLDHEDKDGAIWWYDYEALVTIVGQHWEEWSVPVRNDSGERHFEAVCFAEAPARFVIHMASNLPFQRMRLQRGYHMASPHFGVRQEVILSEWLGGNPEHFGKIVVAKEFKRPLRKWLWDTRQINAGNLDFPTAEERARALAEHTA